MPAEGRVARKVKASITLGGPVRKPKASSASRSGGGGDATNGGKQGGPLVVHQLDFSAEELLINPEAFPELREGDLVQIQHTAGGEGGSGDSAANVLQVKAGSLSANAEGALGGGGGSSSSSSSSKPIRWFSVLDSVADFFGMAAHREVSIERVTNTRNYELGIITVLFSKQYLSSPDMWRLVSRFNNRFTTTGMMLDLGSGVEAKVGELFDINKQPIRAGLIVIRPDGSGTKVVFRSRSAHMHILLQMSTEMWEFSSTGDLYFEKAVAGFLQTLWQRWEELEVTHAVTIVMFSRLIFERQTPTDAAPSQCNASELGSTHSQSLPLHGDASPSVKTPPAASPAAGDEGSREPLCSGYSADGAPYRDFYKVIAIMETADQRHSWSSFVLRLKRHFSTYRTELHRAGSELGRAMAAAAKEKDDDSSVPVWHGRLSLASEGNVLEAVNLSLNTLEQRYRGRDVTRTGESIIVLSPGSAVFETTRDLTNRTKHRCIEDGIAVNLVCLGPAPLHVVPLFIVRGSSQPIAPAPMYQTRSAAERRAAAAMAAVASSGGNKGSGNKGSGRDSPIVHSLTKSGSLEGFPWGVSSSGNTTGVGARYGGFQRARSFQGLTGLVDVTSGGADEFFTELRSPAHARLPPAVPTESGGARLPTVNYVVRWMVLSWFKPEPVSELMPSSITMPVVERRSSVGAYGDVKSIDTQIDRGNATESPVSCSLDSAAVKIPLLQEDSELADLTSLLGFLHGTGCVSQFATEQAVSAVSEAQFLEQCAAHDAQLLLKTQVGSWAPSYMRAAVSGIGGPTTDVAGAGLIRRSESVQMGPAGPVSGRLSSHFLNSHQRPPTGVLRGVSEAGNMYYGLRKSASISELQSRMQRSPLMMPSPTPPQAGYISSYTVPGKARFSPLLGPVQLGGSRMVHHYQQQQQQQQQQHGNDREQGSALEFGHPPPSPLLLGATLSAATIASVEPLTLSPPNPESPDLQEESIYKTTLGAAGGSSDDLSGSDIASLSSSPGVASLGAPADSYDSYSGATNMMLLGDSSGRSVSLGSSLSFESSNGSVGMIRSASGLSLSRFDPVQSSNANVDGSSQGRSRSRRHRSSDNPFQHAGTVFTGRFGATSSWRRRWSHVYNPTYTPTYETADASVCTVNYESLCTPAILPVTCVPPPYKVDETPTWRNIYQVSVPELSNDETGMQVSSPRSSPRSLSVSPAFVHAQELLEQLVSQRLRHDFQIVTDSADGPWIHGKRNATVSVKPSNSMSTGSGTLGTLASHARRQRALSLGGVSRPSGSSNTGGASSGFNGEKGNIGREYLMSRGNYFHKLTVDPEKPSEVTVSRYTPKNLPYGKEDAYVYAVWHDQKCQYEMRHGHFKAQDYDPSHGLNWNTLDTMISRLGASSSSELDYDRPTVLKASTKLFVLLSPPTKDAQTPRSKDLHTSSSAGINTNSSGDCDASFLAPTAANEKYSSEDQRSSPHRCQRSINGKDHGGGDSPSPDKLARGGSNSIGEAWTDVNSPEDRFRGFIDSVRELQPMEVAFPSDKPLSAGFPFGDEHPLQSNERDPPLRRQLDFESTGRGERDGKTGQHAWVWVRHDDCFDARRAFRLEVCWVELEGVAVKEFINRLTSRARAFGFILRELPVGAKADLCRPRQVVSFSPDPYDLEWPTKCLRAWAESRLESDFNFCYDRLLRWPMILPCAGSVESWMSNAAACNSHGHQTTAGHGALVSSMQRLCLAALLSTKLRGHMWGPLPLQPHMPVPSLNCVNVVRRIAELLPRCCNPIVEERVALGEGHTSNKEWAWEAHDANSYARKCTPRQFVHRSGGALLGAGRSATSDLMRRTFRWLEISTPSLTRSAKEEARTDFVALRHMCDVTWWCDDIVQQMVETCLRGKG